jgi:hypothetical protein
MPAGPRREPVPSVAPCRPQQRSVGARPQGGAALLIMMLILILGALAVLARDLNARATATARTQKSTAALAAAKEALLGYMVTTEAANPGAYGLLPCPDIDASGGIDEGVAHTAACLARYRSVMGRFPWKTVGVAPSRSSAGECLWYAVSGTWKQASAAPSELLNTDTNGQFRVFASNGTTLLAGATPAERAVAVIIAPGMPVAGQVRAALGAGVGQCGGNYTAARYLERDAASGIDNSSLAAAADAIDDFITAEPGREDLNDQVIFVTRAEIEARLLARADVQARLRNLTQAVAKCVANYGKTNPAGAADRRLPWPAPVALPQYRSDTQYDDTPVGWLSGRVPDRVNDSNGKTGNSLARVLTSCSAAAVPEWTPQMLALWRNWKDHLFYAVAGSFRPDATPHSTCGTCLKVNGAGAYAAVVMFAGQRLVALNQVRDEPPADADTRSVIANYLEGRNAANHPNSAGNGDYQSGAASTTFNDVLFCIDPALGVAPC